ncbi:MAG TPA: type IV toxin-antitoxin system AbiEi family antitoxin [Methylomirabilota bacterium]|nr:type IV toxin-antitoxin system AbiEi family antitoxin [Methylomirabilota bacterium]
MLKSHEIRLQAAQRLRDLFPRAKEWQEAPNFRIGNQTADLFVKFRMGDQEKMLALEVSNLGQPRQIRETIMRLQGVFRAAPESYPVAVSSYISPQSATILRQNGFGYLDLSGNCFLAFDNVLIEKEGKPNLRPSTRPLKSLFAPRATRVVRALLVEPQRAWRLEELARAAGVSLGHAHNVVKRLDALTWVERSESQRLRLAKPDELLRAWRETYNYRVNGLATYFTPERVTRKFMLDIAHQAREHGRRYAFTMYSGASLVAPQVRMPAIDCYFEGEGDSLARALGLRLGEGEGNVHLLAPYDDGVFYSPIEKGGLLVVSLPQLYVDLYHYERRGREQAEYLRREAMGF